MDIHNPSNSCTRKYMKVKRAEELLLPSISKLAETIGGLQSTVDLSNARPFVQDWAKDAKARIQLAKGNQILSSQRPILQVHAQFFFASLIINISAEICTRACSAEVAPSWWHGSMGLSRP